jgi:hypothetical protein
MKNGKKEIDIATYTVHLYSLKSLQTWGPPALFKSIIFLIIINQVSVAHVSVYRLCLPSVPIFLRGCNNCTGSEVLKKIPEYLSLLKGTVSPV